MACTTELVDGAQLGGVTVNVTATARPAFTRRNTFWPPLLALHPCGSWRARRTSWSVSSPAPVSVTVTLDGWPGVIVLGALTITCRAPGVAVTWNAPRSGRLASADESPR